MKQCEVPVTLPSHLPCSINRILALLTVPPLRMKRDSCHNVLMTITWTNLGGDSGAENPEGGQEYYKALPSRELEASYSCASAIAKYTGVTWTLITCNPLLQKKHTMMP